MISIDTPAELAAIVECAQELRRNGEKHGAIKLYKDDCCKIADTVEELVSVLLHLREKHI